MLSAEGRDPQGAARHAAGRLARLDTPEPDSLAALVVSSAAPMGALLADGADLSPPGWRCEPPGPSVPSVAAGAAASDTALFNAVRALAARPPGVDSLPGRFVAGDLALAGGRHLGLLVVDGDLTLSGGAEVIGAVVARGAIRLQGRGGTITGLAVASSAQVLPGAVPPRPAWRFSRCAAARALGSAAPGKLLPGRSWVPLY
jgi:hypothetical protein